LRGYRVGSALPIPPRHVQQTSPFTRGHVQEVHARWVRPELVAQVAFTEWTRDGKLRHPRYSGLRSDKSAADVVREAP
jgi:bifunctional non-homologous end joining protein LigD